MKKVGLKKLTLTNFRGEKLRTTEFHPEATTITGGNGLGKSRHFDAFCWLLFGKDALDRKDFEIRSIVNREPLHRVECSVEGVLDISGERVTLKRIFGEKWTKPHGQIEEVFKGNETETYWNGVPVNVTEYQRRISEIIPETVFKLITNPLYFATQLKWQEQREYLFQIAGTIADADIASREPDFTALLDRISGKSLSDYKKEIAARKKRLKDDLSQIQPRIDQTHKLTPEKLDFDAIETEIAGLDSRIAAIDAAIADKVEATKQQSEAVQKRQAEINGLKQKQQEILFAARTKVREDFYEATRARRDMENQIRDVESKLSVLKTTIENRTVENEKRQVAVIDVKEERDSLRRKWAEENAKEYVADEACPFCGQQLPENMTSGARALFDENKAKILAKITAKGQELSKDIGTLEKNCNTIAEELKTAEEEQAKEQAHLAELQAQLAAMPVAVEKSVNPEDLQECAQISVQIIEMEKTLHDAEPANTTVLQTQKRELTVKRDALFSDLKKRDLIEKYSAEIETLKAHGKDLAQQIADLEREEYIMQRFTKVRIDECERRINGLFDSVSFKLFDYTIEGNEVETCVALVGAEQAPFPVANTAAQINAGLDIINALTKFYSVSAPIFIDRRESVNELIKTESQIINLVVSNDKELIIK